MNCPFCGDSETRVIDSRASASGDAIRRRRTCAVCNRRFTTYERAEGNNRLIVVKRDGSHTPFDAARILSGVQAACGKRPVAEDTKLALVEEVEADLRKAHDKEVSSREIGERVAQRLRDLDEIAYIRFASEYYRFENVGELLRSLEQLTNRVKDMKAQQRLFDG